MLTHSDYLDHDDISRANSLNPSKCELNCSYGMPRCDSISIDDISTLYDSEEDNFIHSVSSADAVHALQSDSSKMSFVPKNLEVSREHMTTLRLKNIPQVYTTDMLVRLLEAHGVKGFDFISLSFDNFTCVCSGRAIVNFCNHSAAKSAIDALFGTCKWQVAGRQKALVVSWNVLQGLKGNVAYYKATEDIMIPEAFKAVVRENGHLART